MDLQALAARATALVAEAEAEAAAAKAQKAARRRLQIAKLSTEDREALIAKIREWELARDYAPNAAVLRIQHLTCACGATTYGLGQLLLRQQHTRNQGTRRYTPLPDGPWPDLPRHVEFDECAVEVCLACALAYGFDNVPAIPPARSGVTP